MRAIRSARHPFTGAGGEVPWFFNERIEALGIKVANHLSIGGTRVARHLLSGDSPVAGTWE